MSASTESDSSTPHPLDVISHIYTQTLTQTHTHPHPYIFPTESVTHSAGDTLYSLLTIKGFLICFCNGFDVM